MRFGGLSIDREKKVLAENALMAVAKANNDTVENVRKQIMLAMLGGLASEDVQLRAFWEKVPCEEDVPTPEELILYIADKLI